VFRLGGRRKKSREYGKKKRMKPDPGTKGRGGKRSYILEKARRSTRLGKKKKKKKQKLGKNGPLPFTSGRGGGEERGLLLDVEDRLVLNKGGGKSRCQGGGPGRRFQLEVGTREKNGAYCWVQRGKFRLDLRSN